MYVPGGISPENAAEFAKTCRAILEGRLEGTAISLSNMSLEEIEYAEELTKIKPLAAAMSVLDKGAEIRKITLKSRQNEESSAGDENRKSGISKGMAGLAIGGAALLMSIAAKRSGVLITGAVIGGLAAVYIASRQAKKNNKNKKD